MNLLCLIGIHKWKYSLEIFAAPSRAATYKVRSCLVCEKSQINIGGWLNCTSQGRGS